MVSRLCQYSCATTPSIGNQGRSGRPRPSPAAEPSALLVHRVAAGEAGVEEEGAGAGLRRARGPVVVVHPRAVVDRDRVHPRRHAPEPAADAERDVERGGEQLRHHVGPVGHLHLHAQAVGSVGPQDEGALGEPASTHRGAGQELLHRGGHIGRWTLPSGRRQRRAAARGRRGSRRSRSPIPASIRPPVAVRAADVGVGEDRASVAQTTVSTPWTTATGQCGHQDADPDRRGEGQRGEAVEDRLQGEFLVPRPSPSEMLPRMVSGPTQNSSDAVSHPSMNRSRAAFASAGDFTLAGRKRRATLGLDRAGESGEALLDPQQGAPRRCRSAATPER